VVSTVIAAVGARQNNKRRAKNNALAAPPLPTVVGADAPSESDKSPITLNVSTEVENTQAGTQAGNATNTQLKGKTSQTKKEQASKKERLSLKK
jgi:LmbE family N-acetylglucosaminyl deacetylase